MGGCLLAYFVGYVLVWALVQGGARRSAIDLLDVAGPLLAFAFCALAARNTGSQDLRRFWLVLAAAMFLSVLARSTWAYYELARGVAPFPSVADLFGLASYMLEFAAVVTVVSLGRKGRLATIGVGLEGFIFALAAILLIWQYVMLPSLDLNASVLANLVSVAYPGGDVLLLAALASLALLPRRGAMPAGLPWVAGAFLVKVISDLTYAGAQISGTYVTGSWIDPLRPLTFALLGAAAVFQLAQPRRVVADRLETARESDGGHPQRPERIGVKDQLRLAVPYAAMPVACFVILVSLMNDGEPTYLHSTAPVIGALLLVGLVLGRQAITMIENLGLQGSLTALSHHLEERVAQRTRELSVLNQVAMTMSKCESSRQVIENGLRLTKEALGSEAVGLWLSPGRSRGRFFGHDLNRRARGQLKAAAGQAFQSDDPRAKGSAARPLLLNNSADSGDDLLTAGPFDTVAVVPLVSRQTALGALCLAPWDGGRKGAHRHLELASAVAAQIAVAFENVRRLEDAHYLAQRDAITGLLNHRGMNGRLEEEFSRCARSGAEFSVVMMDMDNFKLFNDTYGHAVGDEVLQMVARVLAKAVRKYDVVARYGGDEFVALLPDTSADGAVVLVKRVQAAVQEQAVFLEKGSKNRVPIALSYGIATYPSEGARLADVMAIADANLYRSKQKGGNQVTAPMVLHKPGEKMGVFNVLAGLVTTVDNKDHYTRRHSDDVCDRAVALASRMGLPAETLRTLRIAGILHDVGKIGVPDSVLRKPGALTDEEFEAIKQHVVLGKLIIKEIPDLEEVLAAVATHHERFDGVGYPEGLMGEQIPLLGRILAVSDAYSAMTTDRPYRRALGTNEALTELQRVRGKQLDPELVDLFVDVIQEEQRTLSTVRMTVA